MTYCDKQEILNKLTARLEQTNTGSICNACYSEAVSIVREAREFDVRPVVRGRWIEDGLDWLECSFCGAIWWRPMFTKTRWLYCPNCGSYNGADVRGGDAE